MINHGYLIFSKSFLNFYFSEIRSKQYFSFFQIFNIKSRKVYSLIVYTKLLTKNFTITKKDQSSKFKHLFYDCRSSFIGNISICRLIVPRV